MYMTFHLQADYYTLLRAQKLNIQENHLNILVAVIYMYFENRKI